jgi:hypothetical protein
MEHDRVGFALALIVFHALAPIWKRKEGRNHKQQATTQATKQKPSQLMQRSGATHAYAFTEGFAERARADNTATDIVAHREGRQSGQPEQTIG